MKNIKLIIFFAISFLFGCTSEKIIELKLTEENGYGPFKAGLRALATYSDDSPTKETYLEVSGVPEDWNDIKVGHIETNIYQSIYQDYLMGKLNIERYELLQKAWHWNPDTLNLSKEPVRSKIAFAFGKDNAGNLKIIVDSNNNKDLSDDKILKPVEIDSNKWELDSLATHYSIKVKYERFIEDKIVEMSTPLLIVHQNHSDQLHYNFPQYVTTKLNGEKIAVSSQFSDLSYHNSNMILLDNHIENRGKDNFKNIVLKNEYIEVNGKLYKNLGVNLFRNNLILEKINLPKNQIYSSQVGFKSFPFEGIDLLTKSAIALDDLKGKYILLDFWAIYCGPCIHEMPKLRKLYEKTDRSKFEIVGIIENGPTEAIKDIIDKNSVSWPQILSDETNKINQVYGIYRYPTTLLLNQEGIIVAKDPRGKELEDKILSLLKE